MTALLICGLFVMPASADATTEVVFQDDIITDSSRIVEYSTGMVGREETTAVFDYTNRRHFPNDSAVSSITYNVEGLEVDKLTVVFTAGNKLTANDGETSHIRIEYSTDNVTYIDFPAVETIYSDAKENYQWLTTFEIYIVPECNYIKISDSATVSGGGSVYLRDFKLERNVIAGTPITNGIEFVEFQDDMKNASSRIIDYSSGANSSELAEQFGYTYKRDFSKWYTGVHHITYNVDGLDINTLTAVFTNGNTVDEGIIRIAYSDDNVTYTEFSTVETKYEKQAISGADRYLYTFKIYDIPECKYIKIYDSGTHSYGSLYLVDFKLSKVYGSIYSNAVNNPQFTTGGVVQSTANMIGPETWSAGAEYGYSHYLRFPRMIENGAETGNSAGEVVWKVGDVDFNQVKIAFYGGNLPREQFIKVEYSKDGIDWVTRISEDRQADWWENGVSTETGEANAQGQKLTIATINGITDDWKYIKVSGAKVSTKWFYVCGIDLRNNKSEVEVKGTIRDSLTGKTAGETVSGTVAVENYTGKTASTTNILALYKNNSLIDLDLSPFSLTDEYKETTDTLSITLPDDYENNGTYTLKLFVWDSLTNLKPLYTAK